MFCHLFIAGSFKRADETEWRERHGDVELKKRDRYLILAHERAEDEEANGGSCVQPRHPSNRKTYDPTQPMIRTGSSVGKSAVDMIRKSP